jgi:hypothetical protein
MARLARSRDQIAISSNRWRFPAAHSSSWVRSLVVGLLGDGGVEVRRRQIGVPSAPPRAPRPAAIGTLTPPRIRTHRFHAMRSAHTAAIAVANDFLRLA